MGRLLNSWRRAAAFFLALGAFGGTQPAAAESYSFGVIPQRSAVLTAQYWNPILDYAGRKAGVELLLKVARSGGESADAAARGDYDFIFSNHIFQPRVASAGYRVLLSTRDDPITGQIVTLADSPIHDLQQLAGQEVGFPSASAFVGYIVPIDELQRRRIDIKPVFGSNQEGIMAQLKAGKIVAAGVNGKLMQAYAAREGFRVRVLWESVAFNDLPVAVHPRVPAAVAAAVRDALADMAGETDGISVLRASAERIGQKPPYGFRRATQADYRSYADFYRATVLREFRASP